MALAFESFLKEKISFLVELVVLSTFVPVDKPAVAFFETPVFYFPVDSLLPKGIYSLIAYELVYRLPWAEIWAACIFRRLWLELFFTFYSKLYKWFI